MAGTNRALWRVYVVDPRKAGQILLDGSQPVIATGEVEAQMKAGVGEVIAKNNLDIEQCDIYCEKIAEFIRPRKDTQKVVIAKDEDGD